MNQPTMSESSSAAQAAAAYFEAWNRHDVPSILATFTPDATFWDINMETPVPVAGLAGPFQGVLEQFPDLQFVVTFIGSVGEDHAVAEWRQQGTTTVNGEPRHIDVPGVDMFEISEGKLRSARAYFNAQTMTNQLAA